MSKAIPIFPNIPEVSDASETKMKWSNCRIFCSQPVLQRRTKLGKCVSIQHMYNPKEGMFLLPKELDLGYRVLNNQAVH